MRAVNLTAHNGTHCGRPAGGRCRLHSICAVVILAPTIIGVFAASLGFGGVFGLTTAVLSVGVLCVVVFGLSTAGRSLEELTERGPATTTAEMTR